MKLYILPTTHVIKIFGMLHAHLEKFYQKSILLESSAAIRLKLFTWILKLRANANYHIGYPDDSKGRVQFSHFLSIDINEINFHQQNRSQQSQSIPLVQQSTQDMETQSTVSLKRSCNLIIECLNSEKDWSVMQLVLKGLPLILQNKALFRGVEMETLATTIIALIKV